MGQIITIFGSSGSGKTTLAVNLACAFSEMEKVSVLLAAELNHGGIQTFFETKIEKEKGFFAAMADQSEQPEKYLTQTVGNENIYIMAPPNQTYEVYTAGLEEPVIDTMLRKLSVSADYLIIDATNDLYNGLTLMGLKKASYVICTRRATVTNMLWDQSMLPIIQQLTDGTLIQTISEHQAGCAVYEYMHSSKLENSIILPAVQDAVFYETVGKPIYFESGKHHMKYSHAVYAIAQSILKGEC